MSYSKIIKELKKHGSKEKAKKSAYFFKTGKGQYGEGDVFLGASVPEQRAIAKKYQETKLADVQKLLKSPTHEHRLTALLILVFRYNKGDEKQKEEIYKLYLKNTKYINNWDLVDLSSHKIVGEEIIRTGNSGILYELAESKLLWDKRIAIVANWILISRENKFDDIIKLSEQLLHEEHDLMHKAIGWMLREVGKKDIKVLRKFLKKHHKQMPRTMLRYAIEKMDKDERSKWMKG